MILSIDCLNKLFHAINSVLPLEPVLKRVVGKRIVKHQIP